VGQTRSAPPAGLGDIEREQHDEGHLYALVEVAKRIAPDDR
jgi:hypothetical protein